MGLGIALVNETGEVLTVLTDETNLLHKLLPVSADPTYPMLGSIDWYGDTLFNRMQMSRFLTEWESVVKKAQSPEEQKLIAGIKELAERCRNGVHLYIKFIGD